MTSSISGPRRRPGEGGLEISGKGQSPTPILKSEDICRHLYDNVADQLKLNKIALDKQQLWVDNVNESGFSQFDDQIEEICQKDLRELGIVLHSTESSELIKDIIRIGLQVLAPRDVPISAYATEHVLNMAIKDLCQDKFASLQEPRPPPPSLLHREISLSEGDAVLLHLHPSSRTKSSPKSSSASTTSSPESPPPLLRQVSDQVDFTIQGELAIIETRLDLLQQSQSSLNSALAGKEDNLKTLEKDLNKQSKSQKQVHKQQIGNLKQEIWEIKKELRDTKLEINKLLSRRNELILKPFDKNLEYERMDIRALQNEVETLHESIQAKKQEVTNLKTRKSQLIDEITKNMSDRLELEIDRMSNQLLNVEVAIQQLEKEIQSSIQTFTELYAIFAPKAFGAGKWYDRDASLKSREKRNFDKIFKYENYRSRFPESAAVKECEEQIRKLNKQSIKIGNDLAELRTKKVQFRYRLDPKGLKKLDSLISQKEKEKEKLDKDIQYLQKTKKTELQRIAFDKQFGKEVQKLVKICCEHKLTPSGIQNMVNSRFGDLGPDFVATMVKIINNEHKAIESHYKNLALLDMEYDLAVPGIGRDIVEFDLEKWKSYTGNLSYRVNNILSPTLQFALTDRTFLSREMSKQGKERHQIASSLSTIELLKDQYRNEEVLLRENEAALGLAKTRLHKFRGQIKQDAISEVTHSLSLVQHPIESEVQKLKNEIAKIKKDMIAINERLKTVISPVVEHHVLHIISLLVGKDFSQAEMNDIIKRNFPELRDHPTALLDIIKLIKHEVHQIESRHQEIDEHLDIYVSGDTILQHGFFDSPTACRIIFDGLAECLDFDIYQTTLSAERETARPQGSPSDQFSLHLHPSHQRELAEMEREREEAIDQRMDQGLIGVEMAALITEVSGWGGESAESESGAGDAAMTSQEDLTHGIGLASSTLRGVFSLWQIFSAAADRKKLEKEIEASTAKRDQTADKLKTYVAAIKKDLRVEKEISEQNRPVLKEDFLRFIDSYNFDDIRSKGLSKSEIKRLMAFYEHYKVAGSSVFCEPPDPDCEARGKKMIENLIRICSYSKDLHLLNCSIKTKQAILDKDEVEFARQCVINGSIAAGSLYQSGTSSANIAATHHAAGYDPVGSAKEALKLGGPIAGAVAGLGVMVVGGREVYRNIEEHRKIKEELARIDKEIEELQQKSKYESDKELFDMLINIKKSEKLRIELNEGVITKLRGAKGAFDAATGAANIVSTGIAIAGAATLAGVSATGIGLGVIAGVGMLVGGGLSINEALKKSEFKPVGEQLERVHAAQKRYHEKLKEKISKEGLDAVHANLHLHLKKELLDLDTEIGLLKEKYDAYVDREIQMKLSKLWWIEDDKPKPFRDALAYIDRLHNEKPADRVKLKELIKNLDPKATFTKDEDLQSRAKKLVQDQVLGNLNQGLLRTVGVFQSHAMT